MCFLEKLCTSGSTAEAGMNSTALNQLWNHARNRLVERLLSVDLYHNLYQYLVTFMYMLG